MDAFEATVAKILEAEKYWIRPSYKVELTVAEKAAIENPSMPRPELDLLAFRPAENEVLAVECKSYFDSVGVVASDVLDPGARYAKRYKLFNRAPLRELVLRRLSEQMHAEGLCPAPPRVKLAMAVGHFRRRNDRAELEAAFAERGWLLFTDEWLRARLKALAEAGYDNSIPVLAAKILLRT